jgi:hypothetical protein
MTTSTYVLIVDSFSLHKILEVSQWKHRMNEIRREVRRVNVNKLLQMSGGGGYESANLIGSIPSVSFKSSQ